MSGFKYGVSLYSYTDDIGTVMDFEQALFHAADTGATGIEILSESHIPDYPNPSTAWLDRWFALIEQHNLTPTNMACWVDTNPTLSRDITEEEGLPSCARISTWPSGWALPSSARNSG